MWRQEIWELLLTIALLLGLASLEARRESKRQSCRFAFLNTIPPIDMEE
jgi:hypothetical protein